MSLDLHVILLGSIMKMGNQEEILSLSFPGERISQILAQHCYHPLNIIYEIRGIFIQIVDRNDCLDNFERATKYFVLVNETKYY